MIEICVFSIFIQSLLFQSLANFISPNLQLFYFFILLLNLFLLYVLLFGTNIAAVEF